MVANPASIPLLEPGDFIAYHGTQVRLDAADQLARFVFGDIAAYPEGIHLGSLAQARMRAGRNAVLEVVVRASRISGPIRRVRDPASNWKPRLRRARAAGHRLLVYLNRHEGITAETVERLDAAAHARLDRISDREFGRLVPEAEDSWIALDPDLLEIVRVVPPKED